MDKNEEFGFTLEHLLFQERKCRVCGETKDLVNEFYLIRKNKRNFPLLKWNIFFQGPIMYENIEFEFIVGIFEFPARLLLGA